MELGKPNNSTKPEEITGAEAVKLYGKNQNTFYKHAKQLGIERIRHGYWSKADIEKMRSLAFEGTRLREIVFSNPDALTGEMLHMGSTPIDNRAGLLVIMESDKSVVNATPTSDAALYLKDWEGCNYRLFECSQNEAIDAAIKLRKKFNL